MDHSANPMTIQSTCEPDGNAVSLDIARGQRLRCRIGEDPGTRFTLVDHTGRLLLDDAQVARERHWPEPDDDTRRRPCILTLGMTFDGRAQLVWHVDVVDSAGGLLSEVKHCTYSNAAGTREFFAAIDIFTR